MEKYKIVAVVGSLRKESYNLQLAEAVRIKVGPFADFEILDYSDVPLFNEDIEFPAPESVKRVRDKIKQADGVWFFSPEYNHFFTGVLKNLIDWLSRPIRENEAQVLAGKPAAVSGASLGMSGTAIGQDHLVTLISYLDMNVMNAPRLTVPNIKQQLNADGKLALTASEPFLEQQASSFLSFIKRTK